mmetsp:Transcript_106844/g.300393  ORF Transcript_106844/g.300393 Transcript_106844/m.300393 type:complete len:275 (-) Transcript_106844:142-966(-)
MEPASHLEQTPQIQIILGNAAAVGQVVEPCTEADALPLELLPPPDKPILEARLLELRCRRNHHPNICAANAKVVREFDVVGALVAEAVQIDEGPRGFHPALAARPNIEHHALAEDVASAVAAVVAVALASDLQILLRRDAGEPLEGAIAHHLVFLSFNRRLTRRVCHAQAIDEAAIVPRQPSRTIARTLLEPLDVRNAACALFVYIADAPRLPDAHRAGRGCPTPRRSAAQQLAEGLKGRYFPLSEGRRQRPQEGAKRLRSEMSAPSVPVQPRQ